MKHSFAKILDAYEMISFSPDGDIQAQVCLGTGEIYIYSDLDSELSEYPPEDHPHELVDLPNKYDLDLGNNLVYEFAAGQESELENEIRTIFRSRGAYRRFKDLLERQGLLQEWYDFENSQIEKSLRDWCEWKGIELAEEAD
ncbi:MAG: hypothetical protein HUJ26_09705 [Planctomycetaceae bacterium]|nr:hypothetical protein [Planctomycetaceae bacterium]